MALILIMEVSRRIVYSTFDVETECDIADVMSFMVVAAVYGFMKQPMKCL